MCRGGLRIGPSGVSPPPHPTRWQIGPGVTPLKLWALSPHTPQPPATTTTTYVVVSVSWFTDLKFLLWSSGLPSARAFEFPLRFPRGSFIREPRKIGSFLSDIQGIEGGPFRGDIQIFSQVF